jgi:hypothetical protein
VAVDLTSAPSRASGCEEPFTHDVVLTWGFKHEDMCMKNYLVIAAAAAALFAGPSVTFAQSGGDNPGGRGVTSTGGPNGVTGRNTDGTKAAPAVTTGSGAGAAGGNAALQGNNANSGQGSISLGHIKGGDIGAGK